MKIKYGRYIIAFLCLTCGFHAFAQKVNYSGVPGKVIDAIRNKYPNGIINKIKKKRAQFTAIIYIQGKKTEAVFDTGGNWQQTLTIFEWKDLPDTVRKAFRQSDYWQWRMDQISLMEAPGKENIYSFDVTDVNPFDIEEFRPAHRQQTVKITESGKIVSAK